MTYDQTLKARPTTYKGTDMRSRLEAKYAQYLDSQDDVLSWEYEPQCFAGSRGQYLPDFVVVKTHGERSYRFYVEVKPLGVIRTRAELEAIEARMEIIFESDYDANLTVHVYDSDNDRWLDWRGENVWGCSKPIWWLDVLGVDEDEFFGEDDSS